MGVFPPVTCTMDARITLPTVTGRAPGNKAMLGKGLSKHNHQKPISSASTRLVVHRTFSDPPPVDEREIDACGGFCRSKNGKVTSNHDDAVFRE